MKTTKLNAFTVLEVLITMGVMAIIVSLTYLLYGSFSQQVLNFQQNSIEEQNYEQFISQLKMDVFEAEKIVQGNNTLEFRFYNNLRSISYEVNATEITRTQNILKESLAIKNITIQTIEGSIDLVNKLLINTSLFNEDLEVEIIKVYPPNLSMQY